MGPTMIFLSFFLSCGVGCTALQPTPANQQRTPAISTVFSAHPLVSPSLLTAPSSALDALIGEPRARTVWQCLREGRDPCCELEAPELSRFTREALLEAFGGGSAARLAFRSVAADGTVKLLLDFGGRDAVEAVLIPQLTRGKATTTLCVSSQVGCAMGCVFCATGRMGLTRSLSAEEIASQLWLALREARRPELSLPPLRSIVFMGMGDAGCNLEAVTHAATAMTDGRRFGFSRHRLTLSTVGPSPATFKRLAAAPGQLAWSLHAADEQLRRRLVPTASYSPEELRAGLIDALCLGQGEGESTRSSKKDRAVMLAVTLLAGVNDSPQHAGDLAAFLEPLRAASPRVMVDLIPYNPVDADADEFQRPSFEAVSAFQQRLKALSPGLFVGVRNARGDDDNAACGQLTLQNLKL